MKRIQARFKKYSHAKRCVDINFLHFVCVNFQRIFLS